MPFTIQERIHLQNLMPPMPPAAVRTYVELLLMRKITDEELQELLGYR